MVLKRKINNDNTARRVDGTIQRADFHSKRQITEVFRNKVGDSFWRTPREKHQEEDGLLSFSMKVNGKKVFLIRTIIQQ